MIKPDRLFYKMEIDPVELWSMMIQSSQEVAKTTKRHDDNISEIEKNYIKSRQKVINVLKKIKENAEVQARTIKARSSEAWSSKA